MPPVAAPVVATATVATVATAGTATTLVVASSLTWAAVGSFLVTQIGGVLIGLAVNLIFSTFISKPQVPTTEAARVNVRIAEGERWLVIGRIRQGGSVVFASFDLDGNFWYLIIHCDSELMSVEKIFFDDVEITLDNDGYVLTDEFCLTNKGAVYSGTGPQIKFFQLWTTTFKPNNPVPPPIDQLKAAFPGVWTDEHKLAGTTYSVIKISPVRLQDRSKIFRWRGPVGLGEPSISIVGNWSRCYDPRDETQTFANKMSWKFSRNTSLVWANYRTHRFGRNRAASEIEFNKVSNEANICDEQVKDYYGNFNPRYLCDIAIPESLERYMGEQQILLTGDCQLVFDDEGKTFARCGYYYNPTIEFNRNRDIFAMESVEAVNGESATQGVIVRYTEPLADYIAQPSAAWYNPLYYVEGETPTFIVIDALAIQEHDQALRLAKAIGSRSQPLYKLLPTVGLKGLFARTERIVSFDYDNEFAGPHEIVTPVEIDKSGAFCGMGIVPISPDRWTLSNAEKKPRPDITDASVDDILLLPTGVTVDFIDGRLEIEFNDPPRDDWDFQFQYQKKTTDDPVSRKWINFAVDMYELTAVSDTVKENVEYFIRYRTKSSGGRVSDWVDPTVIFNSQKLTLTGTPSTLAILGNPYTAFTIGVTGGEEPYIFQDTYGALPPGIEINRRTGEVSGTATQAGEFTDISIMVRDDSGSQKRFANFSVSVSES